MNEPQANVVAFKNPGMSGNDSLDFDYQDFFENGAVALHLVSADADARGQPPGEKPVLRPRRPSNLNPRRANASWRRRGPTTCWYQPTGRVPPSMNSWRPRHSLSHGVTLSICPAHRWSLVPMRCSVSGLPSRSGDQLGQIRSALRGDEGRISVTWGINGSGASPLFHLTWAETDGPEVQIIGQGGFGPWF